MHSISYTDFSFFNTVSIAEIIYVMVNRLETGNRQVWWIWRYYSPTETQENHRKSQYSFLHRQILSAYLPDTSVELYHYLNQLSHNYSYIYDSLQTKLFSSAQCSEWTKQRFTTLLPTHLHSLWNFIFILPNLLSCLLIFMLLAQNE